MNKGKEILKEFLKEDNTYSLRYSFNGDLVRDSDLFKKYLKELEQENEILHAFLYESGLRENSRGCTAWAENEEMVDWFAIQIPKIVKVYKELNIL